MAIEMRTWTPKFVYQGFGAREAALEDIVVGISFFPKEQHCPICEQFA
jgi:hypothetical protein